MIILTQSARGNDTRVLEKSTASVKPLSLTICYADLFRLTLSQVEAALSELAKKQEDLEQREKAPEETRGEMTTPVTSSAIAVVGAESPESKHQQVVTALSTEKGGSSGTTSSSKEAPLLAPQEHSDSEAMNGIVASTDGGPEWVEHWDESADASCFYDTVTQVKCQDK